MNDMELMAKINKERKTHGTTVQHYMGSTALKLRMRGYINSTGLGVGVTYDMAVAAFLDARGGEDKPLASGAAPKKDKVINRQCPKCFSVYNAVKFNSCQECGTSGGISEEHVAAALAAENDPEVEFK